MPFVVVGITGANIHDMKATRDTLDAMIVQRPSCKHVNRIYAWIDKGYDFPEIENHRHRGEEQFIELRYWRSVGERQILHNRFRKLLARYERKSENYPIASLRYYRLQRDNFGIGSKVKGSNSTQI